MKNCYTIQLSPTKIAIADLTDYYGEGLIITRINVPIQYRGLGHGSKLLDEICGEADMDGIKLHLEISPSDGLDYNQLDAWYRKRGFKYRGIYIRKPRT